MRPLGASSGLTQASVQIEAGQLGLSRGRVTVDGASSRVRYSAGLSRLDVRDGVDGDDSARNTDGQGTVAVQFSPATALTGRIWAGRSSADLNRQSIHERHSGGEYSRVWRRDGARARPRSGDAVDRWTAPSTTATPRTSRISTTRITAVTPICSPARSC